MAKKITVHKSWNEDRSVGVWGHWDEYCVEVPLPEYGMSLIIGVEPHQDCYTPDMPGAKDVMVATWKVNFLGIHREGFAPDSPPHVLMAATSDGCLEHVLGNEFGSGLRLTDFGYKVVKAVSEDWGKMVEQEDKNAAEEAAVHLAEKRAWGSGHN